MSETFWSQLATGNKFIFSSASTYKKLGEDIMTRNMLKMSHEDIYESEWTKTKDVNRR